MSQHLPEPTAPEEDPSLLMGRLQRKEGGVAGLGKGLPKLATTENDSPGHLRGDRV
jgi:hypothetical protein